MMQNLITQTDAISHICRQTSPDAGMDELLMRLNSVSPEYQYVHGMTRGNWHRLGGVVDQHHQLINHNIVQWAELESGGDVDRLLDNYLDKGYFATRLAGQTHYFTAPTGNRPAEFLQLEIEMLQPVIDRPLVDRDWYPESIEEFLDPLDYPRLDPEPVAPPYYVFRRLTDIQQLVGELSVDTASNANLHRFLGDWEQSSAAETGHFSQHWVLALREYMDRDGEKRVSAKPVSTYAGPLPSLPDSSALCGAGMANAIHGYDRQLGYHFAWFYMMLTSRAANYTLADAVLKELMGAYDYLPRRDLKILQAWEASPYAV